MVRFINILEQIWPIEPRRARETEVTQQGATDRLVPMKAIKDAQKINEACHKV